jgi:hypothetical protein
MVYSLPQREYYCPKCGLVEQDFNLAPAFNEGRGPALQPWMQNLPQTIPAEKWVGSRCFIKGLITK